MLLHAAISIEKFYREIIERKFSPRNQILLVMIFGAFSIYGTLGGMELLGAIANIRDLGPTIAGLIGGYIYRLRKGEFPSINSAVLLSIAIEVMHFGIALLISKPFSRALTLVKQIFFPMILSNAAGMAVFAFMINNLINERATETAKRQIEGELMVARQIQMSIVPRIFPPFPERPEFEIHALLEPAKEVGGDFYDFFFI
jgi:sigma-B regulation protein RsbU (phosphoserine phosphatase)